MNPSNLQDVMGGIQNPSMSTLFSQLFGQGQKNFKKSLPVLGDLLSPGESLLGQQNDPLSLLLGRFLGGSPEQMMGGVGFGMPNKLFLGGISQLFEDNPQFSLLGRYNQSINKNGDLG